MATPAFKEYIRSLLRRGRVNEEHIEEFTTDEHMVEFLKAFTHESFDVRDNYELYELLGDTVINEVIIFYIRERFPRIINVGWLTKLKHNLVSKKMLALMAKKHGIEKHIRYGEEMEKEMKKYPLDENLAYLSMLEDVLEAFVGCLITIVKNSGYVQGVGVEISRVILASFLNNEEISLRYEDIFDAVTRLKQLYETKGRTRWPIGEAYVTEKLADGKHRAIVYGWPLNDRNPVPENRKELARDVAYTKEDAKQKAANKALIVLDNVYHIRPVPTSPYEPNVKSVPAK